MVARPLATEGSTVVKVPSKSLTERGVLLLGARKLAIEPEQQLRDVVRVDAKHAQELVRDLLPCCWRVLLLFLLLS